MKKYNLFLLIGLLVGCGSAGFAHSKSAENNTSSATIVDDDSVKSKEAVVKEDLIYHQSLEKINDEMRDEYEQYQSCLTLSKYKQDCKEMLARLCQIDNLIDTRGGYHVKPYCRNNK